MKKIYSAPDMQVNEVEVKNLMAVSSFDEPADPEEDALAREYNMWELYLLSE